MLVPGGKCERRRRGRLETGERERERELKMREKETEPLCLSLFFASPSGITFSFLLLYIIHTGLRCKTALCRCTIPPQGPSIENKRSAAAEGQSTVLRVRPRNSEHGFLPPHPRSAAYATTDEAAWTTSHAEAERPPARGLQKEAYDWFEEEKRWRKISPNFQPAPLALLPFLTRCPLCSQRSAYHCAKNQH